MIEKEVLESMTTQGYFLKKAFLKEESKLNGITYQLLNALKSNDEKKFIDIVIRIFMSKSKPLPKGFVNMLSDKNNFQLLGYAFLIGLQGYIKNEGVNNDEK